MSISSIMEKVQLTLGLAGFSIVAFALTILLAVYLVWSGWKEPEKIMIVVSPFVAVLGTLIGAFFGVKAGEEGKAKAENEAAKEQQKVAAAELKVEKEEQKVLALQSAATPEIIVRAQQLSPQAFQ
ncbi:MAG: hypothetical protein R3A44_18435 [Caldilineaceae bacterium]